MTTIFMEGGPRRGPGLMIDPQVKAKLEEGVRVVIKRNDVYFDAYLRDDGSVGYTALPTKPEADAP